MLTYTIETKEVSDWTEETETFYIVKIWDDDGLVEQVGGDCDEPGFSSFEAAKKWAWGYIERERE